LIRRFRQSVTSQRNSQCERNIYQSSHAGSECVSYSRNRPKSSAEFIANNIGNKQTNSRAHAQTHRHSTLYRLTKYNNATESLTSRARDVICEKKTITTQLLM